MAEKGGQWIHANDPTTDWDLLHEKYRNGNNDAKFDAMFGAVCLAIELLNQENLNPGILQELQMQLVDKDFGSKSTYLDKPMPKGSKRKKALRPSQDLKKTYLVGAIEAFRKSGLTQEKAVEEVASITGRAYEEVDQFRDYYSNRNPDGKSYLDFRRKELTSASAIEAKKLAHQWCLLSTGL